MNVFMSVHPKKEYLALKIFLQETKKKHQDKMEETNRKRRETFYKRRFFVDGSHCIGCA